MGKPIVVFDSNNGNLFYILAEVKEALKRENDFENYKKCYDRVKKTSDFKNAIKIIREYVDLIDIQKNF